MRIFRGQTLNYFIFVSDEDEELVDRNLECCGRCCVYYIPWLRLQNALYRVVSDIIFELFITLCIILNVLAMAIEHYNQPLTLESVLTYLNYVSTVVLKGQLLLFKMNAFRNIIESNRQINCIYELRTMVLLVTC